MAKICTHTFGDYILALVEKIFSTETHCYLTPEVEEDDYPTVLVTDEKTVTVDKTTTGDDTTAANTTTITKKNQIKAHLLIAHDFLPERKAHQNAVDHITMHRYTWTPQNPDYKSQSANIKAGKST